MGFVVEFPEFVWSFFQAGSGSYFFKIHS